MRRLVLILGLSLALVAAACGDDDQAAETRDRSSSSTSSTTSTTGAVGDEPSGGDQHDHGGSGGGGGGGGTSGGALLTLDTHGGFVPVQHSVGDTAEVVVLADDRVISGAPMTMQYPGPAMAPWQVSTADGAAVDDLVAAFEALDPDADYDQGSQQQVADAPFTTVTLHDGGRTTAITAYALGMGTATGPRKALQDLVDGIQALVDGTGQTSYRPTALRVHDITKQAGPMAQGEPGEPQGTVRDWPLPYTVADCTEVTEPAQVAALLDAVGKATQLDRWRTDAGERALVVVPLLPGDPGCAAD